MKPNLLLTGMLVAVTIAVTSCYAPRLAQQGDPNDDVYNTTARAQEYVPPAPVQTYDNGDYRDNGNYDDNGSYDDGNYDNGYGTSDPYSDMDYSSRINRFSYGSSYIPYFDPYYDGFGYNSLYYPYSSGFSFGLGLGFGWGSPYYGGLYSPFWGFNNYYGGAYGGFYGGGYYGGYYGGGYYSRIRNNPRPVTRSENGGGYRSTPGYTSRPGATRTVNGVVMGNTRRGDRGTGTVNRTNPNGNTSSRPTRTERYTPPQRTETRPTYTPPPSNYGGGRSMGGGSYGGGSMGGGGRSSRGGRN